MGIRSYILILLGLILLSGCSSQIEYRDSKLEIYTDSYSSIKEGYRDNITNFLVDEYSYKIVIENDSIIDKFYNSFKNITERNEFIPGYTKTIYLLDYKGQKDTLYMNFGDTKKGEFNELISLTLSFFVSSEVIK